jgi:hypothetical protein
VEDPALDLDLDPVLALGLVRGIVDTVDDTAHPVVGGIEVRP